MRSGRKGARLGQHFLTGAWAARSLAQAVNVRPNETILEIGPGKGALTKELLATGAHVIAIEKDRALVEKLSQTFAQEISEGRLRLVEDDVRNFEPGSSKLEARSYVLAANIPYYITGEIIRQFLETTAQPRAMALLVQKEVAERIVARDHKESILSLSVKAYGSPKIVAKVSRGNFSPPPSVDSAILLITNISKESFGDVAEDGFFKVVKTGFASKRKFLANNLAVVFGKDETLRALTACNLSSKVRAEDVPLEKWRGIARELS
ncbi:ribosomal RNA small subunit methyltransferase A [Candidatus Kaiserbacteria bacterium RIFCSPHIGHO2_02_FULL_54_11b]|uniref:Ribosomal RNA small subunit methyltransferase A n=2 Tax=Candidatus Kaiseribacteriota TaxID=1752734 RepID=A0A1F6CQU7_9BACT|nr:MAG: ribosomal RNA small subunit methyltransferase A [Candidatus Kaiserbacteria bacterium RIFCSPHIGHO2_01_FULL_54_36b]OGG63864.1 MAG: ribosomal RNA small subunit methyltransferase A [Candidatus Kaiserbacteria bacterium RIFCSPHIGHO2_02_FULL_54_11b]